MPDNDQPMEPKGNQPAVLEATGDELKIEAVAGSGKTTTMVWRIRNEIRNREVPPNRILVLTFANEATHTIKEKLKGELGPANSFEIEVYNYHSFCYQLLQEHAYHVGLSPDFELITEERRPQLIESVYDDIDFEFASPGSPANSGSEQETISELTRFIENMRREAVKPGAVREYLPDDETIRDLLTLVSDLEQVALDLIDTDANDIMWEDETIADNCIQLARVYRGQANRFDSSNSILNSVQHHLRAMADCADSVADHLYTENDLVWQDYRTPEALFEDDRFGEITQTPMGRLREFVHMLRRARAYVSAYESYTAELNDRAALDYDELIHRAVDLLTDDSVSDDILSQWDMVFCDEFQDTDESQLALVDELREEMDIMVIGDSDQAIHEWRGQDPENMSNLPDSFEEINLPDNFRSRQSILDITNNLGRSTQQIHSQKTPDPPNVFKVNSQAEETEKQVSTTVTHLLTDRFADLEGHDLSDIAILVRKNQQAQCIARELERESIPYSLSKDTGKGVSQGLETVLSYLRILVAPDDDVSWQRVLLLLYRVPESDIDVLLEAGETIPLGFESVSASALDQPDRVAEAISDYEELQEISATHSVSELYLHLKRETKVEWFLRQADRDSLGNIEQLISSFSDSPIQTRLTSDFLSYLERQANLLTASDETATSTGSQSDDAIDIMTVHQAKGLDFDTVLLPFLTEDEFGSITLYRYQEKIHSYDILVDSIEEKLEDPLRSDISEGQIAEEWRILHVALTRAKNRLFLFGNDVSDGDPSVQIIDQHLPDDRDAAPIHWSSGGARMRIWSELMESYDELEADFEDAVQDYTDVVNRGVGEDPGKITYYEQELSSEDAIEQVLQFSDRVVERTLATTDTDTSKYADTPLGAEPSVDLSRQHSHTALEAVRECGRRHVLDFVVDAFSDPVLSHSEMIGSDQADIGTLFHEVAELAYWRDHTTLDEWKDACEWISASRDLSNVVDETIECIETYFETVVPSWKPLGAEVPIEMDNIDGLTGTVTGYVDSVREHPDGGLAVLDYKTSRSTKSLEESYQLLLYVRACSDRFGKEITHAGYVYVGEPGPATQLFEVSEVTEQWDALYEDLILADNSSFDDANPGSHCQYCEHRSLGCPEPESAYEDDFLIE